VSATRRWARTVAIVWGLICFALPIALEQARARAARRGWARPSAEPPEARLRRHGARLRDRLVRLGPTFIKVGQMLATRADLLPVELLRELQALHDRVPPFPDKQAFATVERSLGRPLGAVFSEISEGPIAAASLGQVYRAKLRADGRDVAVKVRRPALARRVAADMAVLEGIAAWAEALERRRDRVDWLKWLRGEWVASVHEFERVISEEMDYRLEAQNAARFKSNFAEWPDVYVPAVVHELTTERVLVLEFVEGIKVTDLDGLRAAGFSARALNERLYRTYFKQLFEDGFFHADPHPGNLLVTRDGRLAFFDFGMVGDIDEELQGRLVTAFFHMLDRDVDGIVDDLIALDFLEPGADLTGFRDVVAEVMERRLGVKLSEVRFEELVYDLAPVVYEYPLTTPARFTFLIRALMTLEGISVQMNPDFNFFDVARPYARDFLLRRDAALLRRQVLEQLRDARSGRVEWSRLWRLAKTAFQLYTGA
jgi:predicted unusual protein kinase regulating ubiquinone biosynthesis (AarF/ABC1/UbiB family)